MKFSEYFGLGLNQAELDFVDIELDGDMRLFIDPYALRGRIDPLSVACANDVRVFLQALLDAMRDGDEEGIRELLVLRQKSNSV